MKTPSVGIDLASGSFAAALWLDGQSVAEATFPNHAGGFRQLARFLKRHGVGKVRVGLESTSTYGEALAQWLHEQRHQVLLLNPERVARYAQALGQRNKTDPADARLIAQFVARHEDLIPWQPMPPEQKDLRSLLRTRTQLVEHRKQLTNQLRTADPIVRPHLQAIVAATRQQLAALARQITKYLQQWPQLQTQVRRIMTLKGAGLITAATVIAEIPPVTPQTEARSICAWAGLIPRRVQSGKTEWRSHMSRKGNSYLRNALFMPALVAQQHNPLLRDYAQRLRARGKRPGAVLGAVAHKMLRIIVGLLRSETDFDPHWTPTKN